MEFFLLSDDEEFLFMNKLNMDKKRKRQREEEAEEDEEALNSNNNKNKNTNNDMLRPPPQKKQRLESPGSPPPLPIDSEDDDNKYSEPIELNVGGIRYFTSMQTLTGYKSMLQARFSSMYAMKPSKDGSYFIDRNGNLFAYILEYLRTGELLLPQHWKKDDIWRFYFEIKYFAIDALSDVVLLKLFESNVMKNPVIKLKLCNKLMTVLGIKSKKAFLQGLYAWNLVYNYDYTNIKQSVTMDSEPQSKFLFNVKEECGSVGTALFLIQTRNTIIGLFIQRRDSDYFYFGESFAFRCDLNGLFDYYTVRFATEEEEKVNDDVYSLFNRCYPILIKYTNSGYVNAGNFQVKNFETGDTSSVARMEVWSLCAK